MLKNPEYLRTNPEMFGYCQTFLQNYWDACTSIDGYSTEGKYIGAYCVAFIAYDSSGTVVARNYALVAQGPSESTTILLR